MTPPKTRILVVDDHPLVREWLTQLINREPDLAVCGEAADAQQAHQAVARLKPAMAIVDLSMKGVRGIELLKELRAVDPALRLLVLSTYDESLYAERALRAGAGGYVTKQEAADTVRLAIRKVLAGQIYLSEKMAARLLGRSVAGKSAGHESPVARLSDRERQVFQFIGRGLAPRQIADEMRVSVKTVEGYVARIKEKLHLQDSGELLRYAIEFDKSGGA